LPAENWGDLAADERVLWIEPFWPRRAHNNSNRINCEAETVQATPYNLDGSGVMVGEWDEGQVDGSHPDLTGRVIAGDGAAIATHSTHVAGTVLGSGVSFPGIYRGMAPAAEMISHLWWDYGWELESDTQGDIDDYDLDISQNSWGVGYYPINVNNCNAFLGNYFSECGVLDDIARGDLGKPITIVWSAGNERSTYSDYCGSVGFTWGTIGPYATAKNVICVGAINSNNSTMTSFSSWGPTDDGRLKPELVAPGCQTTDDYGITSTKPGSGYVSYCGTSMSAPTVSGCVALWLEQYRTLYPGQTPLASTVRAVLVESADNLGDTGPEYDFGYGRLDIKTAVDRLNAGAIHESALVDQETDVWSFFSDGSLTGISITLAWDDPGASANANPTLINDLDLQLHPPAGETPATYYPWVLNPASPATPATTGQDRINNLEQVRIAGTLPAGIWTVEVIGYSVPTDPQAYSLAHSAGIQLTEGGLDYAVSMVAETDTIALPGDAPVAFRVSNDGLQSDTYDMTLTSARGWTITPNPASVAVAAQADSLVAFTLQIPSDAPPGTVDTVQATAVSQGNPGVSAGDEAAITVISGRAVDLQVDIDTLGIPGKEIELAFTIANVGLVTDSIDWSIADAAGWSFAPANGTVVLAVDGDTIVHTLATISEPEAIGLDNPITVTIVSRGDGAATDAGMGQITVIDYPPQPIGVAPADLAVLGTASPRLEWSPQPHVAYPSGFDVFTYAAEISADELFSSGTVRYDGIADTTFDVPDVLADGAHYWRIRSYNLYDDSSDYSPPLSFDIDTEAPAAPVLLSPTDGAWDADTTPVFTWLEVTAKSLAAPVAYRWEMSPDPLFATDVDSVWTATPQFALPDTMGLAVCSTVVYWRVTARDDAGNWSAPSAVASYSVYQPGDLVYDCVLNILDVVRLVEHVFRGGTLPDPPGRAETNCTPPADILDVVTLVGHVFRGGPLPCGPE
ncbi:MAG TPA: S8 family serine peptidase, partial [Acidobacteriota bacterium]|nr:S8 family serine peptidase [Acidobacteriota bacterium]